MTVFRYIILFALLAPSCFVSRGADGLVGFWRSDALTNATVEFSSQGSFRLNAVDLNLDGFVTPMRGIYKIIDTNHIILETPPASSIAASNRITFKLSYSVSGDVLKLETLDWGFMTYHRVQR